MKGSAITGPVAKECVRNILLFPDPILTELVLAGGPLATYCFKCWNGRLMTHNTLHSYVLTLTSLFALPNQCALGNPSWDIQFSRIELYWLSLTSAQEAEFQTERGVLELCRRSEIQIARFSSASVRIENTTVACTMPLWFPLRQTDYCGHIARGLLVKRNSIIITAAENTAFLGQYILFAVAQLRRGYQYNLNEFPVGPVANSLKWITGRDIQLCLFCSL